MPYPPVSFTVLDTETTGFTPRANRVIEFASVRVENGKIVDEYEQLFSIDTGIPEVVQALTRIYPEDLDGKPSLESCENEILEHIGNNTLIVGQNINFDIGMLKGENIDLSERCLIDTSMLASLVYPELASYSLGYVSGVLNLPHEPVHRALGDVHATLALLEKCWDRLNGLTQELKEITVAIMEKSNTGYKKIFFAIKPVAGKETPKWMQVPFALPVVNYKSLSAEADCVIKTPDKGSVQMIEGNLNPNYLVRVIKGAMQKKTKTWVAVKNLEHFLSRFSLPSEVRIIYAPEYLLDEESVAKFAGQENYSADEATLAAKIAWYEPYLKNGLPLHGEEKFIWNAKIACRETSSAYQKQFKDLPPVSVIDHRHLLKILSNSKHPGNQALDEKTHVIADDASMLEDTATDALGLSVSVPELRAATEAHPELTKVADLLQIWMEQVRQNQDLYYLSKEDLASSNVKQLLQRLKESALTHVTHKAAVYLKNTADILEADNFASRIIWIETRQEGSQKINMAPLNLKSLLQTDLYSRHLVTLITPLKANGALSEILPLVSKSVSPSPLEEEIKIPLNFTSENGLSGLFKNPPPGKSIILVTSKRVIEDMYIQHAADLEQKGIVMVCQNMSGGVGRMQAEFLAAENQAVWLLTPWSFEGLILEKNSIDNMFIHTLPFDHPNHAVLQKRAEKYQNAFFEYSLPRLKNRLFRLLRTFCLYKSQGAGITILDERIETKKYGREIRQYLEDITGHFIPGAEKVFIDKPAGCGEKKEKVKSRRKKGVKKTAVIEAAGGPRSLFEDESADKKISKKSPKKRQKKSEASKTTEQKNNIEQLALF